MRTMKNILLYALPLVILFSGCSNELPVKIEQINSEWHFRKVDEKEWLPATVPGCVHTDLIANERIPDPSFRKNELKVKWIENCDWEYRTTFMVSREMADYTNLELNFGGLDTYADVYLNDSLILNADNMFIGYTIPVKNLIRAGENALRIYFHSAVNVGMEKLKKVPYVIMAANELAPINERTNVFTRKAPFHYGWDWGPRLVTCGIWKPIQMIGWNKQKIENMYVKPIQISEEKATYTAIVELGAELLPSTKFELWIDDVKSTASMNKIDPQNKKSVSIDFTLDNPEFWWTNGLGDHKLYSVEVRMKDGNQIIQKINTRIGVRTLELVREKDSVGYTFYFKLNGVPVFMKGANYIPSDIFTTRNTLANYKRVVDDAVKANMNMLRIWGGAIYENDELYDLLDENGILAWNDFMFSCNMQPNDSLHLDNIRKEAEYNVKRLRNHPSIALWCGNNENLRAWNDWGWKNEVTKEQSAELWSVYEKIFYRILPDAVAKYNPEVSYWASSPQAEGNQLSNSTSGDEHDWRIWFGNVPFSTYGENMSRFVSEYGLQAFPEMKTIHAFAIDSDLHYRSPVMEHRQRSLMPWMGSGFNGNEMIKTYIARYYKVPESFEDFVYVSQLMQAEGVKYAIEAHRGNMPYTMGSMYWQINDCWPTMSWASVDYFGRWKALHYKVKNAYQEVLPIINRNKGEIQIKIANDGLKDQSVTLESFLYDFNGKILWQNKTEINLLKNSSLVYLSVPEKQLLSKGNPSEMVLESKVKSGDKELGQNLYYFTDFKILKLEEPEISKTISKIRDSEYEITLSTKKLAKNIAFFTSKTDGFFTDNFFDLIPGKTYKISFIGNSSDLESELTTWCLNESLQVSR